MKYDKKAMNDLYERIDESTNEKNEPLQIGDVYVASTAGSQHSDMYDVYSLIDGEFVYTGTQISGEELFFIESSGTLS